MKYILVVINCVYLYVKAVAFLNNEGKSVTTFLKKKIFFRFCILQAISSDGGLHFYNCLFRTFLDKCGVKYKVETPYHPHMRVHVEVSNRESNPILVKTMSENRIDWDRR